MRTATQQVVFCRGLFLRIDNRMIYQCLSALLKSKQSVIVCWCLPTCEGRIVRFSPSWAVLFDHASK